MEELGCVLVAAKTDCIQALHESFGGGQSVHPYLSLMTTSVTLDHVCSCSLRLSLWAKRAPASQLTLSVTSALCLIMCMCGSGGGEWGLVGVSVCMCVWGEWVCKCVYVCVGGGGDVCVCGM